MNNLFTALDRVPVDQHADAARQAAGHLHFVAAEQGCIVPAQLPGRQRRIGGRQIDGRCKIDTGHFLRIDLIGANHDEQHLARGFENGFTGIFGDSGGATNPTASDSRIWCRLGAIIVGHRRPLWFLSPAHQGTAFISRQQSNTHFYFGLCFEQISELR